MTQWGDRGRIRGTVLMFLERPNRVRFDVMTQLGPAAVLTSDGDTFQLSDLREGAFLHGPTCPENIARLLGISVDAENVLRVLDSSGSPLAGAKVALYRAVSREGYVEKLIDDEPDVVNLTDAAGEVALGMNPFGGSIDRLNGDLYHAGVLFVRAAWASRDRARERAA